MISNKIMKVDELNLLISNTSPEEFESYFVSIVDGIFSVDNNDQYWDIICQGNRKAEYEKILDFLSPTGCFMTLIRRLATDKSIPPFEFSVNRLSLYTQQLIASNSAPIFITSRLGSKMHGSQNAFLVLNAFEYYLFSFASFIYHPAVIKKVAWNGATDNIYCQLALRYLNYFLFNCRESADLLQIGLSQSRIAPSMSQSPGGIPGLQFLFHGYRSGTPACLADRPLFTGSNRSVNVVPTELYHTDSVLNILIECWLNSCLGAPGADIALSPALGSPAPSMDHVCLVRVLIKHCYHFCYARALQAPSPDSAVEYEFLGKLNSYRQQAVPRLLGPRVLAYLTTWFREWPADLTFKILLETWLSAVQPWRYVDSCHHQQGSALDTSNGNISGVGLGVSATTGRLSKDWERFVADNEELYWRPLLAFSRRLQRMDLAVARNAQMLLRVARVLSATPGLDRLCCKADAAPVWADIRAQIALDLAHAERVASRLEDEEDRASERPWWRTILDSVRPGPATESPRRVAAHLRQACDLLVHLLDIDCDQIAAPDVPDRNDFLEHRHTQPEHVVTSRGSRLTDFGRFQVINRLCRLDDLHSKIEYYSRPVCSYEVPLLVSLAGRVSRSLCRKYDEEMRAACCRPDFWGRLSRYVLIGVATPPPIDNDYETSGEPEKHLTEWVESQSLHLRVRLIASKAFLFWFVIIYLLLLAVLDISLTTYAVAGGASWLLGAGLFVLLSGFR